MLANHLRFLLQDDEAPADGTPVAGGGEETPSVEEVEEVKVNEFAEIADEDDVDNEIEFDLEGLDDGDEETDEDIQETPEEEIEVVEQKPAEPKEPKAPEEEVEEVEEEIEPQEEEVQAPEEVKVDEQPTLTPEEQAEQYKQTRTDSLKALTEHYKIKDEDVERLQTEPETVIPELAANMYLDVYESVMKHITQQIPQLIQQNTQQQETVRQNEQAFFNKWPALKGADMSVMNRLAASYRQLNPKASAEQFINEVGAQAHVTLRIPFEEIVAQSQEPIVQTPHRPAAPSAQKQPAARQQPRNEFETLSNEFAEDDIS